MRLNRSQQSNNKTSLGINLHVLLQNTMIIPFLDRNLNAHEMEIELHAVDW